ncbi:MAG: patatin-like phospholipase family protein [Verrucomicrobiota bacterium]
MANRMFMNYMKNTIYVFFLLSGLLGFFAHGSWTRNTALDPKMADFEPPRVDISRYKSVQTRPQQRSDMAVAVAISGGGHRAANFATGVLLALENLAIDDSNEINLLQEIDYFSTVSGGGFPVGIYLASRHDAQDDEPYSFRDALTNDQERYLQNLRRDYQITLLQAGLVPELIGFKNAGDLLEKRFDEYLLGAEYREDTRSLTLGDVFLPKTSREPVEHPYWFANATVYENGARFVFTPGIIREYAIKECTHRLENIEVERDGHNMPLSVGMKTSASFPVLIPATTLKCRKSADPLNQYLHLIDGGLVDNQGIYTALEVLRQDSASQKVLIVIDAFKGVSRPRSRWRASPSGPEMAVRIMKIAIDGARTRLEQTLTQEQRLFGQGEGEEIKVVLLSFSGLKTETVKKYNELETDLGKVTKKKLQGVARRFQREIDSLTKNYGWSKAEDADDEGEDLSGIMLYEDARAVGTTLNITKAQQELLLQAGQEVVDQHREFFLRHMAKEYEDGLGEK